MNYYSRHTLWLISQQCCKPMISSTGLAHKTFIHFVCLHSSLQPKSSQPGKLTANEPNSSPFIHSKQKTEGEPKSSPSLGTGFHLAARAFSLAVNAVRFERVFLEVRWGVCDSVLFVDNFWTWVWFGIGKGFEFEFWWMCVFERGIRMQSVIL